MLQKSKKGKRFRKILRHIKTHYLCYFISQSLWKLQNWSLYRIPSSLFWIQNSLWETNFTNFQKLYNLIFLDIPKTVFPKPHVGAAAHRKNFHNSGKDFFFMSWYDVILWYCDIVICLILLCGLCALSLSEQEIRKIVSA